MAIISLGTTPTASNRHHAKVGAKVNSEIHWAMLETAETRPNRGLHFHVMNRGSQPADVIPRSLTWKGQAVGGHPGVHESGAASERRFRFRCRSLGGSLQIVPRGILTPRCVAILPEMNSRDFIPIHRTLPVATSAGCPKSPPRAAHKRGQRSFAVSLFTCPHY